MDRDELEARLAHLQQEYQRLHTILQRLEGGIAEIQFLLAQDVEEGERGDDAE